MARGFIVSGEGVDQRRVAVDPMLVIGRAGHNGLIIKDTAASRRHLEIRSSDNGFVCRDLNSRNGTRVNGESTSGCQLHDGDKILIGETMLLFEVASDLDDRPSGKTVFLQTVLDKTGRVQELPPASGSTAMLEAAYTVMNALASNFNPCDLVDRILQATTKAIRAHRGAVLFAGPEQELMPCSVCGRVHTIQSGRPVPAGVGDISISESVARRVLRDGENVLDQSGWTDDSIDPSASIAELRLTSILCVPIRTQSEILGILYMDTDIADHEYTRDDLLLAAAAGNSAGLALENARNHQVLLENQRIEQDIEAAWTIQESFLVNDWSTDDSRFEVFGRTQPARVVGGDFYDFVRIDENRVGVLIGDVSGKGVPAALTMAQLLAEFRLCAPGASSPAEVLERLNERLVVRSRRGMFCTIAAVAINLETGRIVGANAGHHPLVVASERAVINTMEASGPPIGIMPGIKLEDFSANVEPGDTLLLYTDGIVEARPDFTRVPGGPSPDGYGQARLEEVVFDHQPCSPQDLIEGVIADVHSYCAPLAPHDDCTMIALRFKGNG